MSAHTPTRCDETYRADWRIEIPSKCDISDIWDILNGNLICNWSWDRFIWNLPELHSLLAGQPAAYDYLYVTRFLKARAAFLALNGPFESSQIQVLTGILKNGIPFAGIYRFLFLFALEQALSKRSRFPWLVRGEDRMFQVNIGMAEKTFLEILEVICLIPDDGILCHGYPIRCWIGGVLENDGQPRIELVPPAVEVRVDIEDVGRYRKVKPTAIELGMKILAGDRHRYFREHNGDEGPCDVELERLCNLPKVARHPLIKCGDGFIQYYRTTANAGKDTLYVVCADRTMRIRRKNGVLPGSVPRAIYVLNGDGRSASTYLVEFDNNTVDAFDLSFRANFEHEKQTVPADVLGTACAWSPEIAAAHVTTDAGLDLTVPNACAAVAGDAATEAFDKTSEQKPEMHRQPTASITVTSDFKILRAGDVVIDLSRKHKARAFLRFVHGQLEGGGDRDFYAEEMREAFNAQFPSTNAKRRWVSDRLREDLFKGMERHFDLIVETIDKASGHFRLKF